MTEGQTVNEVEVEVIMKKKKRNDDFTHDEFDFYTIIGYTSGGAPYGITMDEAEESGLLNEEKEDNEDSDISNPFDFPF